MQRKAMAYLKEWKTRSSRKPLIIRGARQVGKSYLVRQFAKEEFSNFLEINFEIDRDIIPYFDKPHPDQILSLLSVHYNCRIDKGKTLLFLDEIQAAPQILSKLRYFLEKTPEMHIIAAGSLLDFALEDHEFSMPVGRIEYLHLGPMSFEEFLLALGNTEIVGFLGTTDAESEFPEPLHKKLTELIKTYFIIGGMPESVAAYSSTGSFQESDRVQATILATYADDFNKYSKKTDIRRLHLLMRGIPRLVGKKFKYSHISPEVKAKDLSVALHLLSLARICYPVYHTSCEGIPLGATIDEKKFKLLFIDIGLMCSACGLTILDLERASDLTMVNAGSLSEQYIGQHLLYRQEPYREPELNYWMREESTSGAEIDFVISRGTDIIPIVVKSGTTGTLKSMNQFMYEKGYGLGLRFNMDVPSICTAKGSLPAGSVYHYQLLSLPMYLVEQAGRIMGTIL
jgi:predicted AAA+ superfamily ATPase